MAEKGSCANGKTFHPAQMGIILRPLDQNCSADQIVSNIFRMLEALRVNPQDIGPLTFNRRNGSTCILLHKWEAEAYLLDCFRDPRYVMERFDLRRITRDPRRVLVTRICDEPVTCPAQRERPRSACSKFNDTGAQQQRACLTEPVVPARKGQRPSSEESRKPPLSSRNDDDRRVMSHDAAETSSQTSELSKTSMTYSQCGFEQLESETGAAPVPLEDTLNHVATSTTNMGRIKTHQNTLRGNTGEKGPAENKEKPKSNPDWLFQKHFKEKPLSSGREEKISDNKKKTVDSASALAVQQGQKHTRNPYTKIPNQTQDDMSSSASDTSDIPRPSKLRPLTSANHSADKTKVEEMHRSNVIPATSSSYVHVRKHPPAAAAETTTKVATAVSTTTKAEAPTTGGQTPATLPPPTTAAVAAEPSSKQEEGTVVKVHAKTSMPEVPPCGCPETVFYREGQHVGTETRHTEFKRGGVVRDQQAFRHIVGRYMCAFLNSEGGTIYFGVEDDGKVVGINVDADMEEHLLQDVDFAVKSMLDPTVNQEEYSVNFARVMLTSSGQLSAYLKVLEVCVKPRAGPRRHRQRFSSGGIVYLRRDGSVQSFRGKNGP